MLCDQVFDDSCIVGHPAHGVSRFMCIVIRDRQRQQFTPKLFTQGGNDVLTYLGEQIDRDTTSKCLDEKGCNHRDDHSPAQ